MASLFRLAQESADQVGVERVGIAGGFAYSDTDRAGISVLATTQPANSGGGRSHLLGHGPYRRGAAEFTVTLPTPAEAVKAALSAESPIVLADVADNVGGGSSGDGTALLAELIAQGVTGALVCHALELACRVNGPVRQVGSATSMIFAVDQIVWYLSQYLTLEPGDLIATGTPAGVGLSDGTYLTDGDVVELEITGLGRQRQTCRNET